VTSRQAILEYMGEQAYKPLTAEELAAALGVPARERAAFLDVLRSMEAEGLVVRTRAERYGVPDRMNLVVGRFQGHERGYGFVVADRPGARRDRSDLFIPPDATASAMHGDRVIARIHSRGRGGRGPEGEVIRILERAHKTLVGAFEPGRHFGVVTPDDRRIRHDVFVPRGDTAGARAGEKVVVEITRWPAARRNPEGRVIERLGPADAPGVDVAVIIRKYGLPETFPPEVLAEADQVPDAVAPEEVQGRLDLRDLPVITIDGEDAKDLDDAVSLEQLDDGNLRLGVHIADVSHYVREGSALDQEARRRGTSVYLVDRVLPMLPPRLSNGICSLNPRVDRLTLSCLMTLTPDGRVLDHRIAKSVIHSRERTTYEDVAKILVQKNPVVTARYRDLVPTLRAMEALAMALRARRFERGSLDFNFPEARVTLDAEGRPVKVSLYKRSVADQIIEEFMLVANETVARQYLGARVPFLYRIHEPPDPAGVEALDEFLFHFGLHVSDPERVEPKQLQAILDRVQGRPEEHLVQTVVLRSLKLARYAAEPRGHFGLAAEHYTHFTSPIRRYPDLQIHRIITEHLAARGRLPARRAAVLRRLLPEVAELASERERLAEEAERESVELKKVQFMQDKVGQVYDGIVAGVTAFGLFVSLENTVEGLVHVSNLTDDYYSYEEKHYALVGQSTGKTYRLGDWVRVRVLRVDAAQRQVDFGLVGAEPPELAGYGLFRTRQPGGPAPGAPPEAAAKEPAAGEPRAPEQTEASGKRRAGEGRRGRGKRDGRRRRVP